MGTEQGKTWDDGTGGAEGGAQTRRTESSLGTRKGRNWKGRKGTDPRKVG